MRLMRPISTILCAAAMALVPLGSALPLVGADPVFAERGGGGNSGGGGNGNGGGNGGGGEGGSGGQGNGGGASAGGGSNAGNAGSGNGGASGSRSLPDRPEAAAPAERPDRPKAALVDETGRLEAYRAAVLAARGDRAKLRAALAALGAEDLSHEALRHLHMLLDIPPPAKGR
jgi:Spy/CpxP family protein refolding chaperone